MNTFLRLGTSIVVIALASYSVAIFTEQRKKIINNTVLVFLTLGVVLDATATTFMILGSSKGGFTLHGIIGYTSLLEMFTDAVLVWRNKIKNGLNSIVPKGIHLFSRYTYLWWVLAFLTGGILIALR